MLPLQPYHAPPPIPPPPRTILFHSQSVSTPTPRAHSQIDPLLRIEDIAIAMDVRKGTLNPIRYLLSILHYWFISRPPTFPGARPLQHVLRLYSRAWGSPPTSRSAGDPSRPRLNEPAKDGLTPHLPGFNRSSGIAGKPRWTNST